MESLPEINTDILIAGSLGLFAVLGFVKRLVKLFFFVIALAIGAVAGIWGHNNAFSFSKILVENPEPWMNTATGITAFIGAFCFSRTILGFFQGKGKEPSAFSKLGFGIPGAVLSLVLGGAIAYGALTGVRYAGTMAEMERLKDYASDNLDLSAAEPLLVKLKKWVNESRVGQLHQKYDFINDTAQANLAKIAIVQEKVGAVEKLAPQEEEEILHAIPLNAEFQSSIREGDFSALLKSDQLRDASKEAATRDALMKLDIEKALGLRK